MSTLSVPSMHPACFLNCGSCNATFGRNTTAYNEYSDEELREACLANPAFRIKGSEWGQCINCGGLLAPSFLPEEAANELLQNCLLLDEGAANLTWTGETRVHAQRLLEKSLIEQLHAEVWFEPTIPILQACLNTLWNANTNGLSIRVLAEFLDEILYSDE